MLKQVLRNWRKAIRLKVLEMSLGPPTQTQRTLARDLVAACRRVPELGTRGVSASEAQWRANANRLRKLVLSRDPRAFLRWDVIKHTMFASGPYWNEELAFLKSRPDWRGRWEKAIVESPVGCPRRLDSYAGSSTNLIHHAYHLAQFEHRTGVRVNDFSLVFEFGGGYGCMCRLLHRLGFRGRYVVYDLPLFSALQRYYLQSLGITLLVRGSAGASVTGVLCVSDVDQLRTSLPDGAPTGAGGQGLFMATWSLSEVPLPLRESVLPLTRGFTAYILGLQERFLELSNLDYFDRWKDLQDGVTWHSWHIDHLPGNRYLMGVRPIG